MVALTKRYPVVYSGNEVIVFPTEEGIDGITYPANGTEYAEFDTYEEAKAFAESKGLSYKEPIA